LFRVVLPVYEGSLEGLLLGIKKRRFSPLELEISKITSSYLEWLRLQNEIELEESSNMLVFLSELLLIKSGVFLPKPQSPPPEEDSLIKYLKEYKEYKDVGFWIEERLKEQEERISIRMSQKGNIEKEIEVSLFELFSLLKDILNKKEKGPIHQLVIDEPKLEDEIERIKKKLTETKKIEITSLLDVENRLSLIITFLAILELIRLRFIRAIQYRAFSSIWLVKRGC